MSAVHCFTSISFSYLDRARVLAQTLKRQHPEWKLWLCLSDIDPPGVNFDVACEPFDEIVRVEQLEIPDLTGWIFSHQLVELCTAVKGPMLRLLLDQNCEKIVYLDPDIAVFGPLDEIPRLLDQHPLVLTPHLIEPEPTELGIMDNEIGALKHGVYNLGFLAVRNCGEGRRFANWWNDRLLKFCYADIPRGLFTDQKWCDLIPALFEAPYILRDPGYNVASWNLSRRQISLNENGCLLAGGKPLRFFHFTKVNSVGEAMLERYSNGRIEVFELVKWYRLQLALHAVAGLPADYWGFSSYRDGTPILPEHRAIYRNRPDLQRRFPDPFSSGGDMFNHLT